MKSMLKNVLLAASLAALATFVVAQNTDSAAPKTAKHAAVQKHRRKPSAQPAHNGKLSAGEASSLERTEAGQTSEDMRDDNHGRFTSANLQHRPNQVSKAAYHAQPSAAAQGKNTRSRTHGAQLKTGQLTNRQGAHLETKEAALHHQVHSDREQDRKLTSEDQPSKNTNQITLKKHNARMF